MTKDLRLIVIGLGVQGYKRKEVAGNNVIATIDPLNSEATYKTIYDVPLVDFDAAFVCTPDEVKIELLQYLLENKKHVLVEKPLLANDSKNLQAIKEVSEKNNVVCYTAYNHRFEPHFVRMKKTIDSNRLGEIYSIRMFYGNGTARLVHDSQWRDQAAGVLPDLGSHLLDTLDYWIKDCSKLDFNISSALCHENRAFDHVILKSDSQFSVQLEMMLLSWRNHFTCDIYAEKGSAHIESLCKWGPCKFTYRTRVLPSGRPPEESFTLVQNDPTWKLEHEHFINLCLNNKTGNIGQDIWLNEKLNELAKQVGLKSVLPDNVMEKD